MKIASVVLAAGMGTRMKSRLPKMMHPLLGKPIVAHALSAVMGASDLPPVVVLGHGSEMAARCREDARANFAWFNQRDCILTALGLG